MHLNDLQIHRNFLILFKTQKLLYNLIINNCWSLPFPLNWYNYWVYHYRRCHRYVDIHGVVVDPLYVEMLCRTYRIGMVYSRNVCAYVLSNWNFGWMLSGKQHIYAAFHLQKKKTKKLENIRKVLFWKIWRKKKNKLNCQNSFLENI